MQMLICITCSCSTGAVYICTEDVFPTKRLQQLIEVFSQKHRLATQYLSDNIFVEHVATIVSPYYLNCTMYVYLQ